MTEQCSTCRFWRSQKLEGHDEESGNCYRNAPRAILPIDEPDSTWIWSVWPGTLYDEWCGEYEAKK